MSVEWVREASCMVPRKLCIVALGLEVSGGSSGCRSAVAARIHPGTHRQTVNVAIQAAIRRDMAGFSR
jgi:hypothetical protein